MILLNDEYYNRKKYFPCHAFNGMNRSAIDVDVNVKKYDSEIANGYTLYSDDMLRSSAVEILESVTELLLLLHDESITGTKNLLNRNGIPQIRF